MERMNRIRGASALLAKVAATGLIGIAGFSVAGPALAQGYASSLPLNAAERRAMEMRLSTILDSARTNEVTHFALPGGGRAAVRTYRMVNSGNGPCRGYRIDVDAASGRSAVDGYRCRARGGAWLITEPETTLEQTQPLDLQRQTGGASRDRAPLAERLRERGFDPNRGVQPAPFDTARYAREERLASREAPSVGLFGPGEPVPLPERAPQRPEGDEADTGQGPRNLATPAAQAASAEPETEAADGSASPDEAPTQRAAGARAPNTDLQADVARALREDGPLGTPPAGEEASAAPDDPASQDAPPVEIGAVGSPDGAGRFVAGAPSEADAREAPVREAPGEIGAQTPRSTQDAAGESADVPSAPSVASGPEDDGPDGFDTPRIVASAPAADAEAQPSAPDRAAIATALVELDYLTSESASQDEIDAAVDDFASDERVALPIPDEQLLGRLNQALDRSGSLPVCTPAMPTMCIDP